MDSKEERRAVRRVQLLLKHLNTGKGGDEQALLCASNTASADSASISIDQGRSIDDLRDDTDGGERQPTHWHGWGYADTKFEIIEDNTKMRLIGNRYGMIFNNQLRFFPEFIEFAKDRLHLDLTRYCAPHRSLNPDVFPPPNVPSAFLRELESLLPATCLFKDAHTRLKHAHGHTCEEIFVLRHGSDEELAAFKIPDLVVVPQSAAQIEPFVRLVAKFGDAVCLIPFGGGTSVTKSVNCPATESRCILSLDMRRLNKINWVNRNNMTASIQAGILGQDLEIALNKLGLTMGHEPDSSEFSTLGGWIATNSSGMKKNRYGNIDNIVLNVTMVTPSGIVQRKCDVERTSIGPSMELALALGSEGCLGVITQATVRLRVVPAVRHYSSVVFPNFQFGINAMREIALRRLAPSSIRLLDNTQFRMGQALKPAVDENDKWKASLVDKAKKYYITEYHGMDPEQLVGMTLLFEGASQQEIRQQVTAVMEVCHKFRGIKGDEAGGKRGYFLTFMIAYLRDFGLDYRFLSESFETSVPWNKVYSTYTRVVDRIRYEVKQCGIQQQPLVGGRITQTYDTCAVIYFYFGFTIYDLEDDALELFAKVEDAAREEILKQGGSLSHHHGVGKLRRGFVSYALNEHSVELLQGVKRQLDPLNIFAARNLCF